MGQIPSILFVSFVFRHSIVSPTKSPYESNSFVKILLDHGAHILQSEGWSLVRLARMRLDRDIIQTIRYFSPELTDVENIHPEPYSVQEAMIVPGHVSAIQTGNWPATFPSSGHPQQRGWIWG